MAAALLAAASAGFVSGNGAGHALRGAREIAVGGRYEIALRVVEMNLVTHPDDPGFVELRDQLIDVMVRMAGNHALSPVAVERPPDITNQTAVPGQDFTTVTAGIAMIWIAPGSFLMSNPRGSDDDTFVTLTSGFWLGRTEVTQEQLQAVMEHLPPQSFFRGSELPVERISWLNAVEFGRILTERERAAGRLPPGYEYTLPTEAQWEYAARAGSAASMIGDVGDTAWTAANSDRQTHPVAQKEPNAWGLYDMQGNVSEWCRDGYHGYPGGSVTDLMIGYDGPSAAMARIHRGGAWTMTAGQCRIGSRYSWLLTGANPAIGFRLALVPVRNGPATAPP